MKKLNPTPEYQALVCAAQGVGETNDCAVKAVALVCGVPYGVAHKKLADLGRKTGHGTNTRLITTAIQELGKMVNYVNQESITALYPGVHARKRYITSYQPARFESVWKTNHRTYLAFTKGHVFAIIAGTVHDWTANKSKRVTCLYEVN